MKNRFNLKLHETTAKQIRDIKLNFTISLNDIFELLCIIAFKHKKELEDEISKYLSTKFSEKDIKKAKKIINCTKTIKKPEIPVKNPLKEEILRAGNDD